MQPNTLDHLMRVSNLDSDAGFNLLHLIDQSVSGVVLFVQRFVLARAHRHMPGDILLGIWALVSALVARIAKDLCRLPCSKLLPSVTSATWPEVPRTACVNPDWASTPMCAFISKYHWLPF